MAVDESDQAMAEGEATRAAFIIKGPPTYMNAEEARHHFGCRAEESTLFIIIPSNNPHHRRERLMEIIDPEAWAKVIWIETESNISFELQENGNYTKIIARDRLPVQAYRRDARSLREAARREGFFDLVFTMPGDLHEHLAWCLRPEQLYLIDTGNKTPMRVGKRGYLDYRESTRPLKRLSQKIARLQMVERQRTNLFTAYADLLDTKHPIVANTYALQKERFQQMPPGDALIWIGAPFCDRYNVPVSDYLTYIRSAIELLKGRYGHCDCREMIYIPHPGKESAATLRAIQDDLGCRIDDRNLPVELKLARMQRRPRLIVSHFSSSLTNLASVLENQVPVVSAWHPEFGHFASLNCWRSSLESGGSNVEFLDMNGCPSFLGLGTPDPGDSPRFATFYTYLGSQQ